MKKIVTLAILLCILIPAFSQVDFREETIYCLNTLGFYDSESANNAAHVWSYYNPGNPNYANF